MASRLGNTNVGYFICNTTGAHTKDLISLRDRLRMEMVSLRVACSLPMKINDSSGKVYVVLVEYHQLHIYNYIYYLEYTIHTICNAKEQYKHKMKLTHREV